MTQATELRPLALGELLDKTFTLYRNNFALFFGISAVAGIFVLAINIAQLAVMPSAGGSATPAEIAAGAGLVLLFTLVGLIAYLVAYAYSLAATVYAVSDLHLGRPASIQSALLRAKGKLWKLIVLQILLGIATGIGFMLLIIPGILILCKYALSVPAAVLEDLTWRPATERSGVLTAGTWGRIFMIYCLSFLLTYIAVFIFQLPLQLMGMPVLSVVGNFLASTLVAPVATIALSLQYYDARVRKEAFDLQHMMQALGGSTGRA